MPSPIFNLMNGNNSNNLLAKFNEFKKTFQGDPKAEVQKMLNSGQMTQDQYNKLSNMASAFMKMLGR